MNSQIDSRLYGSWKSLFYDNFIKVKQNDSCVFESLCSIIESKVISDQETHEIKERDETQFIFSKAVGYFVEYNDSILIRKYYESHIKFINPKQAPVLACDSLIIKNNEDFIRLNEFNKKIIINSQNSNKVDTFYYKIKSDTLFIREKSGFIDEFKKIL